MPDRCGHLHLGRVHEPHELTRRTQIEIAKGRLRELAWRGVASVAWRGVATSNERSRNRLPDERRIRRRKRRHVPAGLVAPGPHVFDSGAPRRGDRGLQLGDVLPRQPEARHPELRLDAVP